MKENSDDIDLSAYEDEIKLSSGYKTKTLRFVHPEDYEKLKIEKEHLQTQIKEAEKLINWAAKHIQYLWGDIRVSGFVKQWLINVSKWFDLSNNIDKSQSNQFKKTHRRFNIKL